MRFLNGTECFAKTFSGLLHFFIVLSPWLVFFSLKGGAEQLAFLAKLIFTLQHFLRKVFDIFKFITSVFARIFIS